MPKGMTDKTKYSIATKTTETNPAETNTTEFHSKTTREVISELRTSEDNGISEEEADARLSKYGLNLISGKHKRTALDIIIEQLKNIVLILLLAASVVSYFTGHILDSIAIAAAVAISVIFGFMLEYKADQSLRALQELVAPKALVTRGGRHITVDAAHLGPGDILTLEEGTKVPADCRIVEEYGFEVNEAPLTGESVSVVKTMKPSDKNAPLSERTCMCYAGTLVVKGHAKCVVVSTGDTTEIGKIASTLSEIETEETPLKKSLDELGKHISLAGIGVILLFFIIGTLNSMDPSFLFILGISLAVAVVPEGLITVLTIILANGVRTMAENKALVRRMNVVETIGNTSIIVVDKTGTITEGKMSLSEIFSDGKTIGISEACDDNKALRYASMCNMAKITEKGIVGDEMDRAILHAAQLRGFDIHSLKNMKPISMKPLDSVKKQMSCIYENGGTRKFISLVKGAPEIVLSQCTHITENNVEKQLGSDQRKILEKELARMTGTGMRVLAVACKDIGTMRETSGKQTEEDLTFIGLLGFSDRLREEVAETLATFRNAGIRVMMLTGDNLQTAISIGKECGLIDHEKEAVEWKDLEDKEDEELKELLKKYNLIARSTPISKLRIVETLIKAGEIVTVTGDGVNDALALKKAHVGVVMGSGTDVSKEAGSLILMDDNISTLASAIRYGRGVFHNITNFVRFQFTTNIATLGLFLVTFLSGLPSLLTPIQILFINIIMDGPPALALGFEKSADSVMDEKPRKNHSVLSHKALTSISMTAVFMIIITLLAYMYFEPHGKNTALTATFFVFVSMQLANSLNCRFHKDHFFSRPSSNPYLFATIAVMGLLLLVIAYVPELQGVFSIIKPDKNILAIAGIAGLGVLLFEEMKKGTMTKLVEY